MEIIAFHKQHKVKLCHLRLEIATVAFVQFTRIPSDSLHFLICLNNPLHSFIVLHIPSLSVISLIPLQSNTFFDIPSYSLNLVLHLITVLDIPKYSFTRFDIP